MFEVWEIKVFLQREEHIVYTSVSQPLCRGTLVCRDRLSGVPWKIIKNCYSFLISIIFRYYYFKLVLLVIVMSV